MWRQTSRKQCWIKRAHSDPFGSSTHLVRDSVVGEFEPGASFGPSFWLPFHLFDESIPTDEAKADGAGSGGWRTLL